jgi:hypothetical protein
LYQRWIYKVDSKRVNEFGFSQEMLDKKKSEGETTEAIQESTEKSATEKKKD